MAYKENQNVEPLHDACMRLKISVTLFYLFKKKYRSLCLFQKLSVPLLYEVLFVELQKKLGM